LVVTMLTVVLYHLLQLSELLDHHMAVLHHLPQSSEMLDHLMVVATTMVVLHHLLQSSDLVHHHTVVLLDLPELVLTVMVVITVPHLIVLNKLVHLMVFNQQEIMQPIIKKKSISLNVDQLQQKIHVQHMVLNFFHYPAHHNVTFNVYLNVWLSDHVQVFLSGIH